MSGLTDLLSAMLRRAGQQAQATQQGTLGLGPDPNAGPALHYGAAVPGQDVPVLGGLLGVGARVPITALQVAGLVGEAGQQYGRAATGTTAAALGALQAALNSPAGGAVTALAHTVPVVGSVADALNMAPHLGPLNFMEAGPFKSADAAAAAQAFRQSPGLGGEMAAFDTLHERNATAAEGAASALNLLNFVAPLGEVGTTMRLAAEPGAIRTLGAALQGVGKVGEFGNAPGAALFSGAWRGIRGGPMAGLTAAANELGAGRLADLPGALPEGLAGALRAGRVVPGTPALPDVAAPGAPPTVVRPAPQANVPRLVRPAPQENLPRLVRAAPQTGVPAVLPPEVFTREPTFTSGPASLLQEAAQRLGVTARPSQAPNAIADLTDAIRGMTPSTAAPAAPGATTPWEDFVSSTAATYRTPATAPVSEALSASTALPEAQQAALDFTDRTGVIRQAANAPLTHLTSILADLHNALYPGPRADFAIPALTGQPKAAFRTSFLTDHPEGNAAEPYLDYLLNRVQRDSKAAARLRAINPTLADDVAQLAQSDLPLAEHKALIQSLFKGVGETAAPAADVATAAAAAVPGTLDDFNALLTGPWSRSMYVPDAAAFAKRLNVPEAQAQAWIDDATRAGTLTRSPQGDLTFAPAAKAAGGDIAAGGGGGGGLGLVPSVTRLGLSGGGALAGTAVGGAIGGRFGDTPEKRRANANLGGAIGGTLGGGLGLAAGSPTMRAIGAEGVAAMREAAATGSRNPWPGSQTMGYIRSLRKTGLFTVPRNALGAMGNLVMGGGDLPQALRYASEFWGNMPTLLPALRAAGKDEAAKAAAMYAALPADMQAYGEQGIAKLMTASGSAYERNAADLGAANVHPGTGAVRGAILGAASPRLAVLGAPSLALGAFEGATLPARAAMQNAFATAIDVPARVALSFPAYQAGLKAEAPGFIAKVAAVDPALAGTLDRAGTFDPADLLAGVPAGTTPPPALQALADEWAGVQDAVAGHAGEIATDRMGDFTTQAGVSPGGILNSLFPGGVWNVQQAAVLARAAAEHPALALAALHAIYEDYQAHLEAGDPQHAGTWRLTDETPGFGALVRLAAGGKGSYYVNPAYPFSPFSGETLNLPRELDPRLNPNQNLYDRAMKVANALGLAVNPEIQLAAYKEGASDTPMTNPLRLEPVGQYLDARLGLGRTANPLAQALDPQGSTQNMADINLQLRQGKYLDPAIARAGSEIIFEETTRPAGDPRNAQYLAELRDHNSPLYQQALDRALGGKAALAAMNEALPASGQAESETARDVGIAQTQLFQQGIPFTKAQVAALADAPPGEPTAQMALQQAMDAARMGNSLLRVNDVATPEAQAQSLMDDWKRRFSGLQLFPAVYQQALAQQGERLGTVPAGTAAATQALYDALLAGQRPGPVPLWPGGPPPQFDPSPIYQLQDYFNRGGR